MTSTACRALLLTILFAAPASAQTTEPTAAPAPCEQATDDQYGYSRERAIQVGGSPLYGLARQRRYLDALRGPEGQAVTYKRTGQYRADDGTILDGYELTYEGLEKPATLFLDWYRFTPPRAPRGFTCGAPFNLGLPPVDPFQESQQLRAVALTHLPNGVRSPIASTARRSPSVSCCRCASVRRSDLAHLMTDAGR